MPSRTRYAQTYAIAPRPVNPDQLLGNRVAAGWKYLVLNYGDGFGDYHAIQEPALHAKEQLVPLSIDKTTAIYCIYPCPPQGTITDNLRFDNGITLTGHLLRQDQNHLLLFLYWKTDKALDRSYKVSLRLLDQAGTIVYQSDNIPQLWTYPTQAWLPDRTIPNFYNLDLTSKLAQPGTYRLALVLYDEQTVKPAFPRVNQANHLESKSFSTEA